MLSEINENVQGTNNDGKETRTQVKGVEQKEEINIQPEQNENTRIQNNEERLRNLQDKLNVPTSKSSGHVKEKRNSKKLNTYLKT